MNSFAQMVSNFFVRHVSKSIEVCPTFVFFILFRYFSNLNAFLQIIGFSFILYYKYDTYFSLLQKQIIYEHTNYCHTHIPRGTQKIKYLYTLCIGFVMH
jgi:hypothetical protein